MILVLNNFFYIFHLRVSDYVIKFLLNLKLDCTVYDQIGVSGFLEIKPPREIVDFGIKK